ncbi:MULTISPECIES: N-acetylneuraminate synthase family protein [Rhodococcus]|uniref:N-acetylneuraminate synthase family protein n=1 Tax=Rhodococcus TaxID=1827 RepID=UPI00193BB144|nr:MULTISPECIES: N-acetylneuraminate synthase family protein [Rhodococcus]QRI77934.1 N-acetylneuraminate synthase family protein [Rhodococcus aetherivorans]QSE61350.1 N-acetylneuraminate synthase family protein [Rhodococcus sp. PSBB066]QSE67339.1 N-acetylneuraminate synthase family protein [Rhodococcus sp. PSBB049]
MSQNPIVPFVIAEIGCNHAGDLEIAKKMISVAANFCEIDAVKFQKRDNKVLFSEEEYNAPHPNPMHSFGETYGAHREFLEFTIEQHVELAEHCRKEGVVYSTSVWDVPSAKQVASINPEFIKVPSATNLNFDVLSVLTDEYGGKIHISLGMTTREEEERIVDFLRAKGRIDDVVLYACTSGYPVPFDQLALMEVKRLKDTYGSELSGVGFSGHHLGIAADVAAMTLGATTVERHFTLDRTAKGTDHSASLEPDGLRRLKRDLKHVSASLRYKEEELLDVEIATRKKLKWTPVNESSFAV